MTRAGIPQDQKCGRFFGKTFKPIRTASAFADRVKMEILRQVSHPDHGRHINDPLFQPDREFPTMIRHSSIPRPALQSVHASVPVDVRGGAAHRE